MKWVLVGWALLATAFILRMKPSALSHDFIWHVQYSQIVAREHRLPRPDENAETYQPPLYYIVNSFLPSGLPRHILWVKLMSMIYGALALFILGRGLRVQGVSEGAIAWTLAFLATTPAFLLLFSTYNNDSLGTLLNFACLFGAAALQRRWSAVRALIWTLGAAACLYVKLSSAFLLGAIALLALVDMLRRKPEWRFHRRLVLLTGISILLLTPWLARNHRLTGVMTPAPETFSTFNTQYPSFKAIYLQRGPWRTILTPPGWTRGEWNDPFAHVWETEGGKRNSYAAYLFATSLFGEHTLRALPAAGLWTVVAIHAALLLAVIVVGIRRKNSRRDIALVMAGVFAYGFLLFRFPYVTMMDFRYVAWAWYPLSVLRARLLGDGPAGSAWRIAMCVGIVLQLFFIGGLMLGTGQWYWL